MSDTNLSENLTATEAFDRALGFNSRADYRRALPYFLKAEALGHTQVYDALGYMYSVGGFEFPVDYGKAIEYYRRGADLGQSICIYNLAQMHENGQGVPKNFAEAYRLYGQGMELGCLSSQTKVGTALILGLGVAKDYAEGIRLLVNAEAGFRLHGTPGHAAQALFKSVAEEAANGLGPTDRLANVMFPNLPIAQYGRIIATNDT